ncbi:MAG: haloacid dehalogenase-like hydrolase [Acidobacteriota bacterium]|jgi:phosphoglycolate phosphatase-like HAD superfamily hydrolase
MIKLAIFDLDGTLTKTNKIDSECFIRALEEANGLSEIQTDWAAYPHTSDSGIIRHIFQERFHRLPEFAELFSFKQRFVALLNNCWLADSSRFAAVSGAATALARLRSESDWAVALATGCWRLSALMKLRAAEIEVDGIPATFADDGIAREEILQLAVVKALEYYEQNEFEKIVSIGDAVWDVQTAANLEVAFLGIGSGENAVRLCQAGAGRVIDDFAEYDQFVQSLNEAEIPRVSRVS